MQSFVSRASPLHQYVIKRSAAPRYKFISSLKAEAEEMATTNLDHSRHYHLPSTVGAHYFNSAYHPASSQHSKSSSFYNHDHNPQQPNSFSQQSSIEISNPANYAQHTTLRDRFAPEEVKQELECFEQRSQNTSMIDRFVQYWPTAGVGTSMNQSVQRGQSVGKLESFVCKIEPFELATSASSQQAAYWTANSSPKSSTDSVKSAIQAPNQARAIQQLCAKNNLGAPSIPTGSQQLQCLDNDLTPLVKIPLHGAMCVYVWV